MLHCRNMFEMMPRNMSSQNFHFSSLYENIHEFSIEILKCWVFLGHPLLHVFFFCSFNSALCKPVKWKPTIYVKKQMIILQRIEESQGFEQSNYNPTEDANNWNRIQSKCKRWLTLKSNWNIFLLKRIKTSQSLRNCVNSLAEFGGSDLKLLKHIISLETC